ncbi:MAG: DNA mismatch repair protein MutS, partial [Selenomonadaceae bacterium]|nr:DNA mismatch repair protein MutS [Selenomonadaceae bacterium]
MKNTNKNSQSAKTSTPMMDQYNAAKSQNQDALLFFRLGDFYEMFYDDALTASKELGLTMTHRQQIPMCGVPAHALEPYLQKLVNKGYRVALVDQIGDPKAKGLTERQLTKIVTPGTILTDDALTDANNNYITLIYDDGADIALAGADVSTGEFFYSLYEGKEREQNLFDELYRLSPHEILIADDLKFFADLKKFADAKLDNCTFTKFNPEINTENKSDFNAGNKSDFETENRFKFITQHFAESDLPVSETAANAVEFLLRYIHKTVRTDLNHISKLSRLENGNHLILDAATLKNLEVTKNLRDGSKKNTLYDLSDATKTPLGARLLRRWLESPLIDVNAVNRRLDAVEELFKNYTLRRNLREILKEIRDLERLMTKVEVGSANAPDLTALKISLRNLPKITAAMQDVSSDMLIACRDGIKDYSAEIDLIDRAIEEEAPTSIRDGAIIKFGYDENLDEYRKISADSR